MTTVPRVGTDEATTPAMADNPADPAKAPARRVTKVHRNGSGLSKSMDQGPKGRAFATGNNATDYGPKAPRRGS